MAMDIEQLPSTKSRITMNTPESINGEIERQIEANVNYFKRQDKETIERRILHLEEEWDTERVLELNMAAIALVSSLLGLAVNKKWMYVSGAVSAFMLQHAIQGWCPPLPLIRKLGVRTVDEINLEKQALQNLLDDEF